MLRFEKITKQKHPPKKKKATTNKQKTSTTPSCSGPIPAQKSTVNSVLGSYFPTRCQKWIFIILIILIEKKHTKLIYHILTVTVRTCIQICPFQRYLRVGEYIQLLTTLFEFRISKNVSIKLLPVVCLYFHFTFRDLFVF